MNKKKIVVLTGAGISAESGLSTFRDSGGLWEGHNVMDVASPEGWKRDRKLVLEFYNQRRKQLRNAVPNAAHTELVRLEEKYDVTIITQNVDDLHERAGSANIIHLHGELNKSQSSINPELIYEIKGDEINVGDKCELGSQLRPFIVWFGEMVPKMDEAVVAALSADIFIVIGTSLVVYPAASLLQFADANIHKYLIDPSDPELYYNYSNLTHIKAKATTGTKELADKLMSD